MENGAALIVDVISINVPNNELVEKKTPAYCLFVARCADNEIRCMQIL